MRVFVSYSFIDRELYLLTLLVSKLREKGNIVQLSDSNHLSHNNIANSDMFVGLITNNSHSKNNVFKEYTIAENQGKQRILLIEEGVRVNKNDIVFIKFNRNNPKLAIKKLLNENEIYPQKKTSVLEDIVTAGAVIAGIAALLSLLSNENKK